MEKLQIDYPSYVRLVSTICRSVSVSDWKPDYIIGITRGGVIPATMISHWLKVPMVCLNVSLRDSEFTETNIWMADDAFGYDSNRKNILIVDDINDTGNTINWIVNDWQQNYQNSLDWKNIWNNNVKFAVLVDNLSSKCEYKMDFVGMEINKFEKDVWIDFPWENWWNK